MIKNRASKVLAGTTIAAGSLAVLGVDASAFTQGPQYWGVNSTTGRFDHDSSSITVASPDCVSETIAPETVRVNLRVDVPNETDLSLGTKTFYCGSSVKFSNGVSTASKYRGHFLQVRDYAVYGTLTAK
jgi:Ni/Co efflux regulator RcnB